MLVILAALSFTASVAAHYLWFPSFLFPGGSSDLLLSIGIGLCALGVYILALSGRAMRTEDGALRLILLVSAVFFIPGIGLFFSSWIIIASSPVVLFFSRLPARTRQIRRLAKTP